MHVIPFSPPLMGSNQHFQTISGHLLAKVPGYMPRKVGLLNERAVIPCQDATGDRLLVYVHRFMEETHHAKPAVVLLHGLEGSSESVYIVKMAERLLRAGFHVVRMNMRSCGNSLPYARHPYNAGLTVDLESVLDFTREHISPEIAVVGFSLGANVVIKMLGEDREERTRQLRQRGSLSKAKKRSRPAADVFVAVSPPLELIKSCQLLDSPPCRLYQHMFLKDIKNRVRHGKFGHLNDLERELKHIKTFFEFDHRFTAPSAGFRGALEYYNHCASGLFIENVQVPGLILHSRDDPMIHPVGWDDTDWRRLPHITAELTRHGGHVGWIAKKHALFPDRRWSDYRVVQFLCEWRDCLT